jgi:demethylmenaquinone methyltransferase/2-methoxy-6-polyprenyl-1,4-benzoquinol methylase
MYKLSLNVEKITPYQTTEDKKKQIEGMFDNIADSYDFLNHLLSAGVDIRWRKRAIHEISAVSPRYILDMATGTGDFAFEALRLKPDKIVGVDLSQKMLDVGIQKSINRNLSGNIEFQKGDSENLQFSNNSFDAITVGFGVRNFQNMEAGLSELFRVMKSDGIIAILEPSFPENPIVNFVFNIHFKYITPLLGKIFSHDHSAYTYLPNSVEAFPQGKKFCKILENVGFRDTKYIPLTFGMCALYTARK